MSEGEISGNNGKSRRFAAFISYAHADAAIAAKLQSRLERYRLPKHIAEAHADGRAALGQIFRDREDLAAAPSLSDAIRAVISEAEALVVICSPDAKASRWVGEEIALFRQLHPGRPVLAALVRGEPGHAFPAALTEGGIEPLAADLRREGDGEALGFLKIIAGIAGVPLDALVQRDAQRRLRRVTAITVGALTAMLIMGIMTTFAIQARNEAARQRASAEGLVEYMLTDLRGKLEGVGRLDVQAAVNQRVITHYRQQGPLSTLPSDSLERRARVLHAMGEDHERHAELDDALVKFREAFRSTEVLLKREPQSAKRIFAHGQSEYWIGRIAELREDWPTAQRHYKAYASAAEKLHALDRKNPDYLMEMGWGLLNLGIVRFNGFSEPAEARRLLENSANWFRKAIATKPAWPEAELELANAEAWIASTHYREGNYLSARANWSEDVRLKRGLLIADKRNVDYQYKLALALRSLARAERELANAGASQKHLVEAALIADALINHDPRNATYRDLAIWVQIDRYYLARSARQIRASTRFLEQSKQLVADAKAAALLTPSDLKVIESELIGIEKYEQRRK